MADSERNRHYLVEKMISCYLHRPYSDKQLAERLNTDRTNIYKIRTRTLEDMGIPPQPVEGERGKYYLERKNFPITLRFTPDEALAIYVAGRKLQQQTRTAQESVASALEKLSEKLHKPLAQALVKSANHVLSQEQDNRRTAILTILRDCWLEERKVQIDHRKLHGERRTYIVHPYQIEPSIWGDALYLLGYSEYHNKIASFKIARIEAAKSLEKFEVSEDFDAYQLLQFAWGIWSADNKPEIVRLKFDAFITPRVKETIWHPSQTIRELPEGGCIWEAEIAEPKEMLPWVRGWGSNVEVLEPEEMRGELKKTAVRLNKQYKTMTTSKLLHHIPYAKTNRKNRKEIHLLLYHLIDVGQVALALWQNVLSDNIRRRLAQILGLEMEESGRFIAFIASLHDLGKAGPAYQKKYAPDWLKKELVEAGLFLDDPNGNKAYDKTFPHGTVSTWALTRLLPEMMEMDKRFARKISIAIGGHHGTWPQPAADKYLNDSNHPQWDIVRRDLVWELMGVFEPPKHTNLTQSIVEQNSLFTILSGLVSVADWVGSRNDECFRYIDQPMSSRQYAQRAAEKAQKGLQDLGWIGWQPTGDLPTFANSFAYLNFNAPRDVQNEVIDLACHVEPPTLLILEAPTGIGKTETAVYIADYWLQKQKGRGLYVAMPTQATSNQMYGRIGDFLNHRYPNMNKNYHLVHGQAAWLDELQKEIELQSVGDDAKAHLSAESWFKPRKRTLLAPFGVGTVDQTLMSILQTRHFFVRLFGLSHKVIIFDEVHAYDVYMNTLFHRLLAWLNAIGTSVIILSATLPAKTRRDLVEAYTGNALPDSKADYPALTIANHQQQETISLSKPKSYSLQLDWSVGRDPETIADFLQESLADGGCTAVICNTVQRAQDVYRAIQQANIVPADELILFHARFPPVWRKKIEAKVLAKFGKAGDRPHKSIVVATQVIEQSLDLDFDLMVTDLAPVDLILQRAGRLHRHKRDEKMRYGHPRRLIITEPDEMGEDGLPKFSVDEYVYTRYILLRSFLTLKKQQGHMIIPDETIKLIEKVYGDIALLEDINKKQYAALRKSEHDLKRRAKRARNKARQQLVRSPISEALLESRQQTLEEDDPKIHATMQAFTRDIPPSISLICLHQFPEGIFLEPDATSEKINVDGELSYSEAKELAQRTITVTREDIVQLLGDKESQWKEVTLLRHHKLIVFQNGDYLLQEIDLTLRLTRKYGLEIIKENI